MSTEPRIRHSKKFESLFALLIDTHHIFESKAQVLLFAAAVGFNEKRRKSISNKDSYDPIRMATFENLGPVFKEVLFSITLADKEDTSILLDSNADERILIFEEYASAGLEKIQDVVSQSTSPLDAIICFIMNQRANDSTQDDDIMTYIL